MFSDAEDESDDETKLAYGYSPERSAVLGRDCERECSRSLPFRVPNKRLTPKLSRRLVDFVLGEVAHAAFSP